MSDKSGKIAVIKVTKPKSAWKIVAIVSFGVVAILSVCVVVVWLWKTADRSKIHIDKIDECQRIKPRYTGASKHPAWIKIKGSKCFVLNPKPVDNESVTWTGGCERCMASGKGVFQWFEDNKPGTKYTGIFANGMPNGYGIDLRSNGARYEGNHKGWKYHGKGKFRDADGSVYEGDFKDNKFHGKGKWLSANKHSYVGEWKNDRKHGRGTYLWPSGTKYKGDWKDGKRHGRGTYLWPDGAKYKGDWVAGNKTGKGVETSPKGLVCTGQFKDDYLHGQARCGWKDGWTYDGGYKAGRRHGQGSMTWPDGTKYKGLFANDRLSSPERAELKLLSMCKADVAQKNEVIFGKPIPTTAPHECSIKQWVTNNAKVPVTAVLTFEVVPQVKEHEMGGFAIVIGILSGLASKRSGKGLFVSGLDGLATATKIDDPSRDTSELRNRPGTRYGRLTLKPGESGWLRTTSGHVANGIQTIRGIGVMLEWPEGRLFDPKGCFKRWLILSESKVDPVYNAILLTRNIRTVNLAEEVRRSYLYRCRKDHHQPTCDYLNAVGQKSPTQALVELCSKKKFLPIGQVACIRIKHLELLAKVR